MKKAIALGVILCVGLLVLTPVVEAWWIFPTAEEITNWWDKLWIGINKDKIGSTKEVEVFVENGKHDYHLIKKRTTTKLQRIYEDKIVPEKCYLNKTCEPEHVSKQLGKKTNPVYSYETVGLKINGKKILFDNKGCWVCDNVLACFDKKDGWSENRNPAWRCVLRDGESGIVYNLATKRIIEKSSNFGGIGIERI